MSELKKSDQTPKILLSKFDAFRFPSSDMVQFRALITPCMPTCEPVQCDVLDYTGQTRSVDSYGRKKRWLESVEEAHKTPNNLMSLLTNGARQKRETRTARAEDVMVLQTLRIVDRYGRRRPTQEEPTRVVQTDSQGNLVNRNQINTNEYTPSSSSFDIIDDFTSPKCVDQNSLIAGAVVFLVAQVLLLVVWVLLWKKKRTQQAKEVIVPDNSTDSLSYMYDSGYS